MTRIVKHEYTQPPPGYNFQKNRDYKALVSNSSREDPDLLPFIEKCHYHLDFVIQNDFNGELMVPLLIDDDIINTNFKIEIKRFNTLNELESFVELESTNNYFMIKSFLSLQIEYISISFNHKILGLSDDLEDEIRDYKLRKILET
jgi:hypothetical protein